MPLARALTARGIPSAVVPMPLLHWIPSIGGRSVRPVLERIHHAVRHVCAMGEAAEDCTDALHVPPVEYSLADGIADFRTNPGGPLRVGGSEFPDEFPSDVEPRGIFPAAPSEPQGSVALIGCSAGGYMARIYLSRRSYGGKAYGGKALVHSLVTLGTPHLAGNGLPFENVRWINREPLPGGVRVLARSPGRPERRSARRRVRLLRPKRPRRRGPRRRRRDHERLGGRAARCRDALASRRHALPVDRRAVCRLDRARAYQGVPRR